MSQSYPTLRMTIMEQIIRFTPTKIARRLGRLVIDIEDSHALQALAPLSGSFLPWTVATMRPTAILAIVNDIVINRRTVIVECGSGNSTVFAARALAQHGIEGHIHSIDHHPGWATFTAEAIVREDLQRWASVTCVPLTHGWYDRKLLPSVEGIDLLVVDGPPAYSPATAMARQPALDVFGDKLAPGATVVLDDSWRKGEKRVIDAWRKHHGIELRHQRGGYARATYRGEGEQAEGAVAGQS
jgi:rhodanese-related sulfurtransferase